MCIRDSTPPHPPLVRVEGYSKWMVIPSAWLFRGVLLQLKIRIQQTKACSGSVNAESIDCFSGSLYLLSSHNAAPLIRTTRSTKEHPRSTRSTRSTHEHPGAPQGHPGAPREHPGAPQEHPKAPRSTQTRLSQTAHALTRTRLSQTAHALIMSAQNHP